MVLCQCSHQVMINRDRDRNPKCSFKSQSYETPRIHFRNFPINDSMQ